MSLKVLAAGRQAGKTYKTVAWVLEGRETGQDRLMLVPTRAMRDMIRRQYGLRDSEVMVWNDRKLAEQLRGRRPEVVLEDVERILRESVPLEARLVGVTMTGTPVDTFTDRGAPPDGGCGGCGNWPDECVCPAERSD